ncbi:AraC family transcriptional regulator [Gilliamella intestini]|uniref:Uncharacterized protein n=1 Tax=Gilliamella intestini TaxID=1798183 RepID=A0A1C4BJC7_9GAMM|nr:AraC family transcriptional regulator [Gilliamella intestini]SCC06947.1 hypothetical protein GA0061080_102131 [Gilliamella intestini]
MEVEDIKVCEPISILVNIFLNHGFKIIEQKVTDYHFHELYFKLEGKYFGGIDNINVDKIIRHNTNIFLCSCHWSIVELVYT